MIPTLTLALLLSCAKAPHPMPRPPAQQVTSACEGADRVLRDLAGGEVRRFPNQCSVARCEGADQVRRTFDGYELQRFSWSPACMRVSCERGDQVRRDADGRVLQRFRDSRRCGVPAPVTPDVVRFGLTTR